MKNPRNTGRARSAAASRSIRRHTLYAAAGTLIPIPFIEVVTSTSMQIHMIAQLCDIYGVRFSEHAVKASLATFVGVIIPSGSIGVSAYMLARAGACCRARAGPDHCSCTDGRPDLGDRTGVCLAFRRRPLAG